MYTNLEHLYKKYLIIQEKEQSLYQEKKNN